jgi:hypothetical protein
LTSNGRPCYLCAHPLAGLPVAPPPLSPARGQPQPELAFDTDPGFELDQTPACDLTEPEPLCGGAVHVKQDGRKNRYLVCTASGAGGCAGVRARYESVEEWFFIEIESVIRQAPRGQDLDAELDDARAAALGLSEVVANIVEALQEAPGSRALTARLQQVEAEEAEAYAALRAVVDRAERAQSRIVRARLESLHAAFAADPFDRAAANLALRQAVDRIVLEPGALFLHWRHGGRSHVPFSTEPRKRRASPRR